MRRIEAFSVAQWELDTTNPAEKIVGFVGLAIAMLTERDGPFNESIPLSDHAELSLSILKEKAATMLFRRTEWQQNMDAVRSMMERKGELKERLADPANAEHAQRKDWEVEIARCLEFVNAREHLLPFEPVSEAYAEVSTAAELCRCVAQVNYAAFVKNALENRNGNHSNETEQ